MESESESPSLVSRDDFLLVLTDKGVISEHGQGLAFSRAIALTAQGLLWELDRHGNPINTAFPARDIMAIEWGTMKKDLIGLAAGLGSLLIGIIGFLLLPSGAWLVEVVEVILCFLAALLILVSLRPNPKAYLMCKGEQASIGFTLQVPIEIASSGIREFIEEVRTSHGRCGSACTEGDKEESLR